MKLVYLAEDSSMQSTLYQRHLSKIEGIEVQAFDDGLDVYFALFKEKPDLLISDLMLPSLPGAAALRLLKFDRQLATIPVLILSAITEEGIEGRIREIGADSYLAKPIKPEPFINEVKRLLKLDT